MDNTIILYFKILAAVVIGWKLGVLERKIEDIISDLNDLRKKKGCR